MNTLKGEMVRFESLTDLKPLLSASGPCLSVYMPLHSDAQGGRSGTRDQNRLRWKECLRTLEDRLPQFGKEGRELVESVAGWDTVSDSPELNQGKSIAVFRSGEMLQVVSLDQEVAQKAVLGPQFYIRPLLAEVVRNRRFYLLALSQKNTRLLRCTMHRSEEIPFPSKIKTGFDEWMNQVKPDHNDVNNAMASGSQGLSGPNALAPKGADDDAKNEYLAHFFKQLDRGVEELLKGKTEPLVLCAVEYELPIYRELNRYPHLAAAEVRGAPNGLKAGEMHARAIEALERCYLEKIEAVLADWNHRVGSGASSRLKDVVTAARDGRVLTLLISDSREATGVFNEETHSVTARQTGTPSDQDLVNEAAVQTILHGGNVLVAPHQKMPNGSLLAAIFRY
jgi:hypothetical protein